MEINNKIYVPKEAFADIVSIPDCWVSSSNKVGKGHGEAKLYYGSKVSKSQIFGSDSNSVRCFILKKDLIHLMESMEEEYKNPMVNYRGKKDFAALYKERLEEVNKIGKELILFDIILQEQISGPRAYIKSKAEIFDLLREICLPNICFLSVMKFINKEDSNDSIYYWKVSVDQRMLYSKNRKSFVDIYGKTSYKQQGRPGQSGYRKILMETFNNSCAVTGINIPSLLYASHIKPWRNSKDKEKTDPNNGILLSVLYDRLFDQGFITFDDNSNIMISSWLSEDTKQRLGIKDNKIANIKMTTERKEYLKFHRNFIFKGIIENSNFNL